MKGQGSIFLAAITRQEQKITTRRAILQVAAEEFDAKGYVATAISDIAKRLDLTKGSVYFHFPSKAELASEVIQSYFHMWTPVLKGIEAQELHGFTALKWASRQVAVAYRDDVAVRASVRLMRESALIDSELPTPFVDWINMVTKHLQQAQEAGEMRNDLNIDEVAWHIVATFFGIQEVSQQLSNRADIERRIDTLWNFLLPGIETSSAI